MLLPQTGKSLSTSLFDPIIIPRKVLSHNLLTFQVQTEMESSFGDEETPIDLSQKERCDSLSFLSEDSEFLQPQHEAVEVEPKTTQEVERPVPAYLAASIATHQDTRLVEPPRGHMLQVKAFVLNL